MHWRGALVVLALASGCTDTSAFDDALAADGDVHESPGSTVRLKMLQPPGPDVPTGPLAVRFLLYDASDEKPLVDASFPHTGPDCGAASSFCAEHLEHGHGTSPEQAPAHRGHGIYEGSTTMSMDGAWRLHVNPELSDGQVLRFGVALHAG